MMNNCWSHRWQRWCSLVLMGVSLLLVGCANVEGSAAPANSPSPMASAPVAVSPARPSAPAVTQLAQDGRFAGLPRLMGKATIELTVKGQPILIEVDGRNAPITAGNFVDLVKREVYDGLVFHRVVREPQPFVVQGGDPQSKDPQYPVQNLGTGGFIDPATAKPRNIPLEIKPQGADQILYGQTFEEARIRAIPELRHTRGAVAMARSINPDSASSQFYIALSDLAFLDGNYAVFGYVTQGMEVVDRIQQGDRIQKARILSGAETLK